MLRAMIIVAMAALTFNVVGAQTPTALPTGLTQAEASAGWISLFDGQTDFGWRRIGDADWAASEGCLRGTGVGEGMLATRAEFADFDLRADFWIDEQTNSGIFVRCPVSGEVTADNSYEVNIDDAMSKWPTGSITGVAKASARLKTVRKWTSLRIVADGPRLIVEVGGKQVVYTTNSRLSRGAIALQHRGSGSVRFRNVRLRPLHQIDLLNGKDLTGWKVVPGHPSVYSVTPEGWMNVKGGNGDIQTETVWGDFILQLDIISNGDHLNSGVFYRANAGQFWSGYEAQIRNQWEGDDRSKAVDYGTGGIYNRQPARRVVSTDRQWFTMTVVANGKHMATWVNGYQVTDFTDERKENQGNARDGVRTAPGVISLQGHDPTTDLSFRKVRVTELPASR